MKVDILAIGAHPDDVELSCGGSLAKHLKQGGHAAIVDLTRGELGSRGTAAIRIKEAAEAASLLGIRERINLELEDAFFQNERDSQLELIKAIRFYQPELLLINAPDDRHPDHARAAQLAKDAAFLSGLARIETEFKGAKQDAWRPKNILHYIQFKYIKPDIVVDISEVFEQKMQAIRAYQSQFHDPNSTEVNTFISSEQFLRWLEARARETGQLLEYEFAEGFIQSRYSGIDNLLQLH